MKRLLILLLAASASTPAMAQHAGHTMTMPMPMPSNTQAAHPPRPAARPRPRPAASPRARNARPVARRQAATPARRTATAPAARRAAVPPANPHAGHNMQTPSGSPPAGQPAHDMSSMPGMEMPAGNAPAGEPAHDMSSMPGMEMPAAPTGQPAQGTPSMPGHDMSNMGVETADPPAAPPPPAALSGPVHAADTAYPPDRMANARGIFRSEHGAILNYRVLFDQLEARIQNGRAGYAWDGEAWYGGASNRLWLKSEGEGTFGHGPEQAEAQALWSRAIDPWFNVQAGVRYDFRPDPERGYLVLGLQGLAPYWFEVDGAFFISEKGDVSARFEGEYEQRITQRLILQPRIDLDFALQDVPEIRIGSGLSSAEAGLRLRYEVIPEFAPYVGVHYGRAFGDTARFRRAAGEDVGGWSFLLGVRTWF